MFVTDLHDGWQVVMQTDHADLSAGFAEQWADRSARHDSLVLATRRHDDGWAVWEQAPLVEPETGKPVNSHLAFYRANIASVAAEDAYAGLLVSMHGAGIYRRRYGLDDNLRLTHQDEVKAQVDAFVEEQEAAYPERIAAAGVTDEVRWADYRLLQVYDWLAIYFGWNGMASKAPGELFGLRIEPTGEWRARIEPFPFLESPAGGAPTASSSSSSRRCRPSASRSSSSAEPERPPSGRADV
jgi:hypothetical protein